MKQVSAGGTDILLARVKGKYHAVGAHCTHYGAPLADGALCGERIVCPWHHACFNVTTGDLEEPPALDSLPCYEVRVEGESVIVSLPDEVTDRRTPAMAKRDSSADERLFVILGGGAAGYTAAQTLREDGFKGRILMITREDRLPYDRPNLSKDYLQGHAEPEWMPLRATSFIDEHDIEVMRGKEVVRVDAADEDDHIQRRRHARLRLAARGDGRRAAQPRHSRLRSEKHLRPAQLRMMRTRSSKPRRAASRAVVIGASFIGMEAACSLSERGLSVTVVAPGEVPFEKTLGAGNRRAVSASARGSWRAVQTRRERDTFRGGRRGRDGRAG